MRRRVLKGAMIQNSGWDYILYNDGEYVPFLRIPVKSGQKITIEYDHSNITDWARGYIYDMRDCGAGYCFAYQLSEKKGQVEVMTEDGTICFSGHYTMETKYKTDRYQGKYLKIRIE